MALAVAGFSLLWAATTDFAALAGARSGIGTAATTAFIAGHILGTVLLRRGPAPHPHDSRLGRMGTDHFPATALRLLPSHCTSSSPS
jgi:hypothetical protein